MCGFRSAVPCSVPGASVPRASSDCFSWSYGMHVCRNSIFLSLTMATNALSSHRKLGNGALMLPRQPCSQQLESSYAEGRAKQRRSRNHGRGCSLLPQLFVVKPGIYWRFREWAYRQDTNSFGGHVARARSNDPQAVGGRVIRSSWCNSLFRRWLEVGSLSKGVDQQGGDRRKETKRWVIICPFPVVGSC